MVGVRRSSYRSDQGASHYDVSKTTPMASLIYKLTPDVSFYASAGARPGRGRDGADRHRQPGRQDGAWREQAAGTGRALDGTAGGTLLSAALFDIERPGYYTNTSNVFTADGEQRYRGLELSTQGKLTRQLSWQTSAQLLDPASSNINAPYNGKAPENASKRTPAPSCRMPSTACPACRSMAARITTGARPVNDLNQAFLGGVTLFSAGARYAGQVLDKAVVWQLNVDNAADKRYWAGAGTRLASGTPRPVKLSMKVDL